MSSTLLPKIEANRLNASLTFFVFVFYMIIISWVRDEFPDLTNVSTIILLVFNVSLITLIFSMLNISTSLRKYFSKIKDYNYWYGSDEDILLNTKRFQTLMDEPISKIIIGFTLFVLSIGLFISKVVRIGIINLILLSNEFTDDNKSVIALGIIILLISLILITLGIREAIINGIYSWHFIFKLRIDRIDRGKKTDLIETIGEQLSENINYGDHQRLQQILFLDHERISELFVEYQQQVDLDNLQFIFENIKSWGYPQYTIFVDNLSRETYSFNSKSNLGNATNFYKFNLDDEIEDHRATIFDILFDIGKSKKIFSITFTLNRKLREIIEIDYLMTLTMKFMILRFREKKKIETNLDTWFDQKILAEDVKISDPENYKRAGLNIQSIILTNFFLINGLYGDNASIDLRYKSRENSDLKHTQNINLKPKSLSEIVKFMNNIILPDSNFVREDNTELDKTMKNLKYFYDAYKEYKVDNHADLKSKFALINPNINPYHDLPFEMFNEDMTFTKYFQYMTIKREETVKYMLKILTQVSDFIGEIKLEDIIFRKIDKKLKNKDALKDNTVRFMNQIIKRIKLKK